MHYEAQSEVIGEAGVNHNDSLEMAKELIRTKEDSNADYVKFQTFNLELVVTEQADKADY